MKKFITICFLYIFSTYLVAADPGDEQPSSIATSGEEGCYVNDSRINNLTEVLRDIEAGEKIQPLKLKIGTYLEFSSTYIDKLGRKNIHIITEDCANYPTELDDLPFKIALDFEEVYNRLIAAIRDGDDIKSRFISRNVISRPVDLNGALTLLTKTELDKELASKISKVTSARPVKDNSRPQDVKKGNYKVYLIPLDLFRSTGGKVIGSDLRVGLAQYGMGAICPGMDSSAFYTADGTESAGWLPNFRDRDEPYLRARSLLKSYGIKVNQISCKEYIQQASR